MRRTSTFILFFLIVAGVFAIIDSVIYAAVALTFNIVAPLQLLLLGLLLGAFSASFIIATILGNYYYNWFTRIYYTLSAVWIGLSIYLFLASLIFGLLVTVVGAWTTLLGLVCMSAAVVVSIYGVFHARKIIIERVTVRLPYLSDPWEGRSVVWISDLHLGQIRGSAFTERVVQKISELAPDMVFIGGDLFDGTRAPDLKKLSAPLKNLKAPLGVYFVTGNHEEFGESSEFISAVQSASVRVLSDEMVSIDGLQLIGVDYHTASDKERFKEILAKLSIDPRKPSILLKHEPKDLDVANDAGISLQISGHTHRAQMWPQEYIARLGYGTFTYGLNRFKNMQVFTSSGVGTWGPPMRVGTNGEIVVVTVSRNAPV